MQGESFSVGVHAVAEEATGPASGVNTSQLHNWIMIPLERADEVRRWNYFGSFRRECIQEVDDYFFYGQSLRIHGQPYY